MNMSRIFLFTTIFFTIFPSIIRKIFHCNDFSYPPSPWTIHKILCHIAGSQQFSHGQAQTDTIHPLFVNESGYSHFHCHYQSVSKCYWSLSAFPDVFPFLFLLLFLRLVLRLCLAAACHTGGWPGIAKQFHLRHKISPVWMFVSCGYCIDQSILAHLAERINLLCRIRKF